MEPYEIAATAFGAAMLLYTTRELVRRKIGLLQYSFWISVWAALVLIGAVPPFRIAILVMTEALGMYTPIHFVTTFSILGLFAVTYVLGKRIGELNEKVNTITQHIALQNIDEKIAEPRQQE